MIQIFVRAPSLTLTRGLFDTSGNVTHALGSSRSGLQLTANMNSLFKLHPSLAPALPGMDAMAMGEGRKVNS